MCVCVCGRICMRGVEAKIRSSVVRSQSAGRREGTDRRWAISGLAVSRDCQGADSPTTSTVVQHNHSDTSRPVRRRSVHSHSLSFSLARARGRSGTNTCIIHISSRRRRAPSARPALSIPSLRPVAQEPGVALSTAGRAHSPASIYGYATFTDWTAPAPISRHSGYIAMNRRTTNHGNFDFRNIVQLTAKVYGNRMNKRLNSRK